MKTIILSLLLFSRIALAVTPSYDGINLTGSTGNVPTKSAVSASIASGTVAYSTNSMWATHADVATAASTATAADSATTAANWSGSTSMQSSINLKQNAASALTLGSGSNNAAAGLAVNECWDNFSAADGPIISGTSRSDSGGIYTVSNVTGTAVYSNHTVASGAGSVYYLEQHLPSPCSNIGAVVGLGAPNGTLTSSLTLIIQDSEFYPVNTGTLDLTGPFLHCGIDYNSMSIQITGTINGVNGQTTTVSGVNGLVTIAQQTFDHIITDYSPVAVNIAIIGSTMTMTAAGQTMTVTDNRIAAIHGHYVIWEQFAFNGGSTPIVLYKTWANSNALANLATGTRMQTWSPFLDTISKGYINIPGAISGTSTLVLGTNQNGTIDANNGTATVNSLKIRSPFFAGTSFTSTVGGRFYNSVDAVSCSGSANTQLGQIAQFPGNAFANTMFTGRWVGKFAANSNTKVLSFGCMAIGAGITSPSLTNSGSRWVAEISFWRSAGSLWNWYGTLLVDGNTPIVMSGVPSFDATTSLTFTLSGQGQTTNDITLLYSEGSFH